MSKTQIEWTQRPGTVGETWNPTTGCNKVDRGCKHCYAEVMHRRLMKMGQEKYSQPFLGGAVEHPDTLEIPFRWTKPRTVFVNSMSDLFHANVSFEFIDRVFQVIDRTPQHTYLILTKRPEIAARYWQYMNRFNIGQRLWHPPRNLWIGTSVNDQKSADLRVPLLVELEASIRFISYEPATGPVNLEPWLGTHWRVPVGGDVPLQLRPRKLVQGIDWVICGGESGPHAQPMHPDWPRAIRSQCTGAGVPYFFKQWGQWLPITYQGEQGTVINFTPGKNEFLFNVPYRLQNMVRTRKKSNNELDGQLWQQFPQLS